LIAGFASTVMIRYTLRGGRGVAHHRRGARTPVRRRSWPRDSADAGGYHRRRRRAAAAIVRAVYRVDWAGRFHAGAKQYPYRIGI